MKPRRSLVFALALLLAGATLAVYFPVNRFPFISLNDGEYVTDNLRIQTLNWETVRWSLTTFHAANWHPVTWLSHAIDYQLFSLDPAGHHDSNLLLHVLNALLLFWILWRSTGKPGRSFMVAALFALHPINVESVAWIAERKNLLSMFFLLLTLASYQWYARRPRVGAYVMVVILFALALMSKPQVVTLPFLLLLWDYWPLERIATRHSPFAFRQTSTADRFDEMQLAERSEQASSEERQANGEERFLWLVVEKLPLFALSAACALLTMEAQRAGGAMGGALQSYSLVNRVENAIVAYSRYVGKAIWPAHLAFFYPHPPGFARREVLELFLLLAVITAAVIANWSRRYLLVGWLWFLGALVPMIGIVQVGNQGLADRYGYLPFVGLFIAICWLAADWSEERHLPQPWLAAAGACILLVLAFVTRRQLNYWSGDLPLWSHTVAVTRHNPGAETVLGEILQKEGHPQEAILHFRKASAMDPHLAYPHYHIGVYDEEQRDLAGALEQYRMVIAVTRGDRGLMAELRANTLMRMSAVYRALGDYSNAENCFQMAQREQQKLERFAGDSSQ